MQQNYAMRYTSTVISPPSCFYIRITILCPFTKMHIKWGDTLQLVASSPPQENQREGVQRQSADHKEKAPAETHKKGQVCVCLTFKLGFVFCYYPTKKNTMEILFLGFLISRKLKRFLARKAKFPFSWTSETCWSPSK